MRSEILAEVAAWVFIAVCFAAAAVGGIAWLSWVLAGR
jgi:hypothetical protein